MTHREALESLYSGRCSVIEYQSYTKSNKVTSQREVVTLENQPCRLSIKNITAVSDGTVPRQIQTIKLFLPPNVTIKAGSKIKVTQNGVTTDYQRSGVSAVYPSHQEIVLELCKEYA